MAVDEYLRERIIQVMHQKKVHFAEKRMFGGLCIMVEDKMCFGTYQGGLMARVGPGAIQDLVEKEGAEQMLHGGRVMTGYLLIQPEAYDSQDDLEFWIQCCLDFNPLAKASKKK